MDEDEVEAEEEIDTTAMEVSNIGLALMLGSSRANLGIELSATRVLIMIGKYGMTYQIKTRKP